MDHVWHCDHVVGEGGAGGFAFLWIVAWISVRFRASILNWSIVPASSFSTDCSKAVPLLQFFVCALVLSYVAFVLSLFKPHRSLFRCLKSAVLQYFGISCVCLLTCTRFAFYLNLYRTVICPTG